MKKAKIKKERNQLKNNEEGIKYSLKSIIVILIVIFVLFCLLYLLTTFIVSSKVSNEEGIKLEIDAKKILMKDILNQNENSYYILIYKRSDANIELYNKYINQNNENYTFYKVDLNDIMNKKFIGDSTNISDNLDELIVSNTVLLKIEKNTIFESYTKASEIENELKSL